MKRPGALRPGGRRKKTASASTRCGGACEARTWYCAGSGSQDHHVLRRSQGGGDTVDNLLWVCGPCHGYIHANPAEAYERGWLRRSGTVAAEPANWGHE